MFFKFSASISCLYKKHSTQFFIVKKVIRGVIITKTDI